MMMSIQNLVLFCQLVLKKKQILTSIKGRNSVANLRQTKIYNTNVDLVNDNVYTKFGLNDPGSILGRVGVLFPWARDTYSPKVLVIPRNRWLRLNMTEKLFTGTLNKNQNKKQNQYVYSFSRY